MLHLKNRAKECLLVDCCAIKSWEIHKVGKFMTKGIKSGPCNDNRP